MNITLKFISAIVMTFALFIALCGKIPTFGRHFIAKEPGGFVGDLRAMSELDRFKENITPGKCAKPIALDEAEILTLGDSFLNSNLGSDIFASELAKRSGYKVYNMPAASFSNPSGYPLEYLKHIGYHPGKRRILIMETVERGAISRSNTYHAFYTPPVEPLVSKSLSLTHNEDVEYFFKKNEITRPLIRTLKNIRFRCFGIVDKSIGAYSESPDMLIFKDEVQFNRSIKSTQILDSAADSIASLSDKLKKV